MKLLISRLSLLGYVAVFAAMAYLLVPGDVRDVGGVAGFLPHSAAEVTERLYVALVALLGAGTGMWMILNVLFQMRAYDRLVGDGVDGQPSIFMKDSDPEPYLRWGIGWLVCYTCQWNFFAYLLGFTLDQYLAQSVDFTEMGFGPRWIYGFGWNVQVFLTGGALAQGPDFVRGIGVAFASAKNALIEAMRPKEA